MTLVEWYVTRASGIVAFALLTVAVILGLTLSGRARLPAWPRFAIEDVHRFAGLVTGTFVTIHVFFLFIDAYMPFSLAQLVVPGASSYRPLGTALGIVGAELLLALAITNRYRKSLSYGFWRRAHYFNFAVWGLALVHGLVTGTDRGSGWAEALYIVSAALVAGFLTWRVGETQGRADVPTAQRVNRATPHRL